MCSRFELVCCFSANLNDVDSDLFLLDSFLLLILLLIRFVLDVLVPMYVDSKLWLYLVRLCWLLENRNDDGVLHFFYFFVI